MLEKSNHRSGDFGTSAHQYPIFSFIDADNVKKSFEKAVEELPFSESTKKKFKFHRLFDLLTVDRNYFYSATENPEKLPSWLEEIRQTTGFVLKLGRLQMRGSRTKQEGVDVKLAIDATRLAYTKTMRSCVLFGGDGDFIPLVEALSEAGCIVNVLSFNNPDLGNVAPRLQAAADQYLRVNNKWLYHTARQELENVTQSRDFFHEFQKADIVETVTIHGEEIEFRQARGNFYANFGDGSSGHWWSCGNMEDLIVWGTLNYETGEQQK